MGLINEKLDFEMGDLEPIVEPLLDENELFKERHFKEIETLIYGGKPIYTVYKFKNIRDENKHIFTKSLSWRLDEMVTYAISGKKSEDKTMILNSIRNNFSDNKKIVEYLNSIYFIEDHGDNLIEQKIKSRQIPNPKKYPRLDNFSAEISLEELTGVTRIDPEKIIKIANDYNLKTTKRFEGGPIKSVSLKGIIYALENESIPFPAEMLYKKFFV